MDQNREVNEKNLPTPEEQAKIFSAKSKRARIRLINRIAYFIVVALVLAENIIGKLPFVYSVEVKKEYPSTLVINIQDEKESFYFEYDNKYFVLTSGLKVLAVFDDENKLFSTYGKLAFIEIEDIKQVITTKEVVFFDDEAYRRSTKVLRAILESQIYVHLTSADISDLYDVRFMYDDRIELVFGSHIDIEKKISHALSIISKYSENAKGKIYIYDLDEAYAMIEDK